MNNREDSFVHVKDIKDGQRIRGLFLVKEKRVSRTRNGKPFIAMVLADNSGRIDAKIWDNVKDLSPLFEEGDVIEVVGIANSYKGQVQLSIPWLKRVPEEEIDPLMFVESVSVDPEALVSDLKDCLSSIKSDHLIKLVRTFTDDSRFMESFKRAPAAKKFHHNYLGGLLEHTLSVCRLAIMVASHYSELDHDLLIAAAFLHDIGKIRELDAGLNGDYTDEGRLIGHIVLGISMLDEKISLVDDFPVDLALKLKHLILSHHGQFEFGSPKRPKFLEAFALNLIDDLDAKVNGLGRFMKKDQHEGSWTDFNRLFGRYFYKD